MADRLWMAMDTFIADSLKVEATSLALGVTIPAFIGHMACLWGKAASVQEDGYILARDHKTIATWALWKKDSATFLKALQDNGWIDADGVFHEWEKWGGRGVKSRADAAERTRQSRERERNRHSDSNADVRAKIREDKSREDKTTSSVEAKELCELLASLIELNGSKKPAVTKSWLTSADRLLRLDQRDFSEAKRVLAWCQADDFWRANILSMPKFREKYDQLRLKAPKPQKETPLLKPLGGGEW